MKTFDFERTRAKQTGSRHRYYNFLAQQGICRDTADLLYEVCLAQLTRFVTRLTLCSFLLPTGDAALAIAGFIRILSLSTKWPMSKLYACLLIFADLTQNFRSMFDHLYEICMSWVAHTTFVSVDSSPRTAMMHPQQRNIPLNLYDKKLNLRSLPVPSDSRHGKALWIDPSSKLFQFLRWRKSLFCLDNHLFLLLFAVWLTPVIWNMWNM